MHVSQELIEGSLVFVDLVLKSRLAGDERSELSGGIFVLARGISQLFLRSRRFRRRLLDGQALTAGGQLRKVLLEQFRQVPALVPVAPQTRSSAAAQFGI